MQRSPLSRGSRLQRDDGQRPDVAGRVLPLLRADFAFDLAFAFDLGLAFSAAGFGGGARVGSGTLHRSIWPAMCLYHSSRRLRRASTSSANSGVSVRSTSMPTRSFFGTSEASLIDLIGVRCAGCS